MDDNGRHFRYMGAAHQCPPLLRLRSSLLLLRLCFRRRLRLARLPRLRLSLCSCLRLRLRLPRLALCLLHRCFFPHLCLCRHSLRLCRRPALVLCGVSARKSLKGRLGGRMHPNGPVRWDLMGYCWFLLLLPGGLDGGLNRVECLHIVERLLFHHRGSWLSHRFACCRGLPQRGKQHVARLCPR